MCELCLPRGTSSAPARPVGVAPSAASAPRPGDAGAMGRRRFLAGAAAGVLLAAGRPLEAAASNGSTAAAARPTDAVGRPARQAPMPAVVPRAEWGSHLLPTGPIPDEPDVRFLLVHHTVNPNDYGPDQVIGLLEQVFRFHTSPDKGWPDIAYNFLIDRFGTVYEGRTGSLAGAKAADATGGSQGFAQLCCFIGDHSVAPPSDAAFAAMVGMLAWLGDRHGLDLSPGATTTFVSRGSNRRPAGTEVRTATISGHRDMSATACPGDFAYAYVADGTFARLATEARAAAAPPTTAPPPPPTEPPSTSAPPPTEPPTTAPTTAAPTTSTTVAEASAADVVVDEPDGGSGLAVPAAVAGAAAITAAALALRARRNP
jgi:hypothetical protein